MATRMQQRRGTAADWASENPILAVGEIGFETDTLVLKCGDGTTPWNDLTSPYLTAGGATMTGALVLQAPTEDDHAARKIDVDTVNANVTALGSLLDLVEIKTDSNQVNSAISTTTQNTKMSLSFTDPEAEVQILAMCWASVQQVFGTTGGSGPAVRMYANIDGSRPAEFAMVEFSDSGAPMIISMTHARVFEPSGNFSVTMELWQEGGSNGDTQYVSGGMTALMLPA